MRWAISASQPPARMRAAACAGMPARACSARSRTRASRTCERRLQCSRAARAEPTSRGAGRAPARRAHRGSPCRWRRSASARRRPRSRKPLHHLALVAGQLQVHVQLHARVGLSGEVVEPLVEGQRLARSRRPRSRAPARAGRRACAARRTRSCRRRAPARPGSSRGCCRAPRGRRPCARRGSGLALGAPVGRAVVVALAAGADRRVRSAGRGGRCDRRPTSASRGVTGRRCARPQHQRATRANDAQRLVVAHRRRACARVDPARKQASDFQTLPMPARLRWSSRASPMPRVWSSSRSRCRKRGLVELAARMSGPSAASGGRSGCASRSSARARGRRTAPPRARPCGSRARRAGASVRQRRPRGRRPTAAHAQMRVQGEVAVEADEQVLAVRRPRRARRARPAARASDRARSADGRLDRRDRLPHQRARIRWAAP